MTNATEELLKRTAAALTAAIDRTDAGRGARLCLRDAGGCNPCWQRILILSGQRGMVRWRLGSWHIRPHLRRGRIDAIHHSHARAIARRVGLGAPRSIWQRDGLRRCADWGYARAGVVDPLWSDRSAISQPKASGARRLSIIARLAARW